MRLLACLIVAPRQGYDEPGFLSYTIRPFCPTSADGLQHLRQCPLGVVKRRRTRLQDSYRSVQIETQAPGLGTAWLVSAPRLKSKCRQASHVGVLRTRFGPPRSFLPYLSSI